MCGEEELWIQAFSESVAAAAAAAAAPVVVVVATEVEVVVVAATALPTCIREIMLLSQPFVGTDPLLQG